MERVDPRHVRTFQDAQGENRANRMNRAAPFFGKILKIHTDRMTADVETANGVQMINVPVLSRVGLQDGEIHGELDMPAPDDVVLLMPAGRTSDTMVVVGTVAPFLVSDYAGNQVGANSSAKQFTTKLLEADLGRGYRRIFKSGTTIEVEDDGTLIIETPSGTYIKIDEANGGKIEIQSAGEIEIGNSGHAASAREGDETVADTVTDSTFFGLTGWVTIVSAAINALAPGAITVIPSSLTGKINEGSNQVNVGNS